MGARFLVAKGTVKSILPVMADLSIVPYHQKPGSAGDRRRRQDRRSTRGLMVDTRTGFSSMNRRNLMDRASQVTLGVTPGLIRKRLRRDWQLQTALSTPAPTM